MTDWTDDDIMALVQRIDDLENELGIVTKVYISYHEWKFNNSKWECSHCPAVRICIE